MAQLFPFTDPMASDLSPPKQFVRGEGIRVFDADGKAYIDAVSALWCASLGFAPDRLRQAMDRQMGELAYYHSFMGRTPEITNRLAQRLAQHLPGPLNHVFFGTSGSEAVETAAKFARYYQEARGKPDKRRFIAREGAYHGSGQMSAALTGLTYCHDGFGLPLADVLRTGRPHFLRDADPGETEIAFSKRRARELDALIRQEDACTITAFIGEPAMGAGGVILPPEGYWSEIQEVLARHDILLIADEIICGFGRTGQWFACETYDIAPDMMTMAKQLTAAVFPMSAVAMTDHVRDTMAGLAGQHGTLGHGVTYGGHPVGAAVALECLDIYAEMDLPTHVQTLGDRIGTHLQDLKSLPGVLDVRRDGMLAAVEFDTNGKFGPDLGRRIGEEAERRGVFFRIIGDVLAIAPPYICTPEDIDDIMLVMRDSIGHITGAHHLPAAAT
ncbi:aminotransferase class III-fold pyridoxal phosphate-dependent enzyme [Shimia sp. SDUM112013]|uniref:aminotransferase class III-fold pyridoxal phosphate-dependent enzyme n=1 Tax=Shimia sp. SDUM112013 TaxID=3136160 RepID=UPI0032F076FC